VVTLGVETDHQKIIESCRAGSLWQKPGLKKGGLPREINASFDLVGGTEPRSAIPVALAPRETRIWLSAARRAFDGQTSKIETVYQYLTGRASAKGPGSSI
jgi:hypothetical protein